MDEIGCMLKNDTLLTMYPMDSRMIRWGLILLGGIAVLRGVLWLLPHMLWIGHGGMDSDVTLYFTVGRGLLNGLTPYTDLFEMKPPIIFFLSALSLLLHGDEKLLSLLAIASYVVIACIPASYAWFLGKDKPWQHRTIAMLFGLTAGLFCIIYLFKWTNGMDIEVFGTCIVSLYALTLVMPPKRLWLCRVFQAFCLFLSIGLKEYYVLITLAVALVACSGWKEFFWSFIVPLLIGAGMGLVFMTITGTLTPYVSTYLPILLKYRISSNDYSPSLIIALNNYPFIVHLLKQNKGTMLAFGIIACCLWLLLPSYRRKQSSLKESLQATGLLGCVLLTGWQSLFFLLITFNAWKGNYLSFPPYHPALLLASVLALSATLLYLRNARVVGDVLITYASIYLLSYTVVNAGLGGNHFAALTPFYITLLLLLIRRCFHTKHAVVPLVVGGVFAFCILFTQSESLTPPQYARALHGPMLEKLDALMEKCHIDRWYSPDLYYALAFSKHSPVGPLFNLTINWPIPPDHPIVKTTESNILQTPLIVSQATITDPNVAGFVQRFFTSAAPECAAPYLPIADETVVLFRNP